MEHGAEAHSFPWTEVKDMNSCRGKSRIIGLVLHGAKDEENFWAHAPYLGEAFDGGTKATQFAEAKLGSEGLGMRQEDAEASTLEEYAIVDEDRLPKERTLSKVEETLRCVGRGHTLRDHNSSSSHKDQNAMEMSPGGDMVQRIVVEQFVAMRYTRVVSREGLYHTESYWQLHFGEQHDGKKGYGFKE
ncbi:hypothetical protein C4D60_Mb01t33010 [Musa balbisiana]|uniref:Uncharacterized protein n=1 Tax=Musa balbisiana TaxID=52838 RepID=A0A4S8JSG4_MUSBA|nr:hypothetical protein C4D60_Mb01t33010 [Musa balbisiana]